MGGQASKWGRQRQTAGRLLLRGCHCIALPVGHRTALHSQSSRGRVNARLRQTALKGPNLGTSAIFTLRGLGSGLEAGPPGPPEAGPEAEAAAEGPRAPLSDGEEPGAAAAASALGSAAAALCKALQHDGAVTVMASG